MKTHYHYNTGLNMHVVEFTFQEGRIDSLEPLEATPRIEGVLVCPDEPTARTIAAGGEAIELLRATVAALNYQIENAENGLPYPSALIKAEKFLANLHAEK